MVAEPRGGDGNPKEWQMENERKQTSWGRLAPLRRRLGPVGMSLAAAALTAAAFAAISVADSDNSKDRDAPDEQTMWAPPPGGGAGVMSFRARLSEEDQEKLEQFRQCMEDNGAPKPPDHADIDPSEGPPEPPSEAEIERIEKAYEACKDELPEDLRNGHPPHLGGPGCEQPPGAPQEEGQRSQGSTRDGSSSAGSAA
jgi:hypothetical protein